MKVNLTYRFISLFFVVAVLVSSMGIIVDMHYCNNELKSISFSSKAKPCHKPTLKQCPFHSQSKVNSDGSNLASKKGCCENKTKYFHSEQDQQIQTFDYKLFQFSQLFVVIFLNEFSENYVEEDVLTYKRYRPPIIQKDIPVLIQSFLL